MRETGYDYQRTRYSSRFVKGEESTQDWHPAAPSALALLGTSLGSSDKRRL